MTQVNFLFLFFPFCFILYEYVIFFLEHFYFCSVLIRIFNSYISSVQCFVRNIIKIISLFYKAQSFLFILLFPYSPSSSLYFSHSLLLSHHPSLPFHIILSSPFSLSSSLYLPDSLNSTSLVIRNVVASKSLFDFGDAIRFYPM